MESNSIGTDASMATHISNIIERDYAQLDTKTRKLTCSELGRSLIEGYYKIDSGLVQPKVRAEIEGNCKKVREGKQSLSQVIEKSIA